MKKLFLFTILLTITSTIFAEGDIVLSNANQYRLSIDAIKFKLVIKDLNNNVVNEVYSKAIMPRKETIISDTQLGITEGSIDYYIQDVNKQTGFIECMHAVNYNHLFSSKIDGWYNQKNSGCLLINM
jgi:hypothetical protein